MSRGGRWLLFGVFSELSVFLLVNDDADRWKYADLVDSATTVWTVLLLVLVLVILAAIVLRRHADREDQLVETVLMAALAGFILVDVLTPDPTVLLHLHHEWIEIIAAAVAAVSYWAYWRVNTPGGGRARGYAA